MYKLIFETNNSGNDQEEHKILLSFRNQQIF